MFILSVTFGAICGKKIEDQRRVMLEVTQQQWVDFFKDERFTELRGQFKNWICDLHCKTEDFSSHYPYPQRLKRMAVPSHNGPPVIAVEIPSSVEVQPTVLPDGTMETCVNANVTLSLSTLPPVLLYRSQ